MTLGWGMATIGFIFLGGAHQVLHMAPVALALARRRGLSVQLFAASLAERQALMAFWQAAGEAPPQVQVMTLPPLLRVAAALGGKRLGGKRAKLLGWASRLRQLDVLVSAERTSTMLKQLPGSKPYMVHIPHGAGDRAKGFEPRIGLFDHVLVAGPKDRDRLVADGICKAADITVTGYVKLAAVRQLRAARPAAPLFDNGRPTVLYNPHFDAQLGSWPRFGRAIVEAFRQQEAFNLVLAPHARLAELLTPAERAELLALALPGRVRVDLGSEMSHDMSYTTGADLYLGDVSSQVYEFLATPKPCVLIGTAPPAADDDKNYAFRRFGEVVWSPAEVMPAIARAAEAHAGFAEVQRQAIRLALGAPDAQADVAAADAIQSLAQRRLQARAVAGKGLRAWRGRLSGD